MPSETPRQRRFIGAELQRKREGQPTKTNMTTKQLREFASAVKKFGKKEKNG